jgi:hypothetical protein
MDGFTIIGRRRALKPQADRRQASGLVCCVYTTLWGTTRLKSPVNANGSGAETTCMLTAHSLTLSPLSHSIYIHTNVGARLVSVLLKIHPAFAGEFRPGNARWNKPKSKQTPA